MNISEAFYSSTRASITGTAGGKRSAGPSFFSSMEELRRELADPESDFYQDTYAAMRQTLKENDQRRKEEAIEDALMAAVDSMTGTGRRETEFLGVETGAEPGPAQEDDSREPVTAEMLALLAALSGDETAEPEEGREAVQEAGCSLAALAERYDPHRMTQEEFVAFIDALAAEDALAPEDAETIKNTGRWTVRVVEWRLEDGNGRVIDSGTGWTPPGRMDQIDPDSLGGRWVLPCLYDGGEDDGDVLAWARLGCRGAHSGGYQTLVDILTRMESFRAENADSV